MPYCSNVFIHKSIKIYEYIIQVTVSYLWQLSGAGSTASFDQPRGWLTAADGDRMADWLRHPVSCWQLCSSSDLRQDPVGNFVAGSNNSLFPSSVHSISVGRRTEVQHRLLIFSAMLHNIKPKSDHCTKFTHRTTVAILLTITDFF